MSADPIASLTAEMRAQTMAELRALIGGASDAILQKLAVDLVPALFRNDYRGESAAAGQRWAQALARPRFSALPTFLVHLHATTFTAEDADALRSTMLKAHITQAALAVVADTPLRADIRVTLGNSVPWILDTDGLVNLMMNANVGVTSRVYETKYVNPSYFR